MLFKCADEGYFENSMRSDSQRKIQNNNLFCRIVKSSRVGNNTNMP